MELLAIGQTHCGGTAEHGGDYDGQSELESITRQSWIVTDTRIGNGIAWFQAHNNEQREKDN